MEITYEIVKDEDVECCREVCNKLMAYQKSLAHYRPELFDDMNFDTRMLSSVKSSTHNFTVVAKADDKIVAYVYSNIAPKENYDNEFATFFDLSTVRNDDVGCLSNFYIEDGYRGQGIGSVLFNMSMEWLKGFPHVEDYFVFVSNGNDKALEFYQNKGFQYSNKVLDGFITTLRYADRVEASKPLQAK
ncbi:GNAT family N-acetyltransferase [Pseudalkalibacillus sp. SCS-8]|uniref:GNAT family N-acetyltransferase n=1 Tax=Pseudalkalibacillus nanhaiensis TaxID=3115291 RepID=UPI0032D9D18C